MIGGCKITDLGCGQVGIETGQAFASLEHMLEYFYDKPFPRAGEGHVPLTIMSVDNKQQNSNNKQQ